MDIRKFLDESNKIEALKEIEGIDYDQALETSEAAWRYIRQKDKLTHENIQQTHRILIENQQPEIAGEYRDQQVYVGNREPEPSNREEVREAMEYLLKEHRQPENTLEALKWHIAFEQIHPFADGNGRIGRILYAWHCRKLGEQPIVFHGDDRQGYYSLFSSEVNIE